MDTTSIVVPDHLQKLEDTIVVSNAFKKFGSGEKSCHVMHNLNMTVKKGTIYALLGASGCGKTTLLSTIVGYLPLDYGDIRVCGQKLHTPGLGVPGSRIGYMPQETALTLELSIEENIAYLGWVHGMKSEDIKSRITFLTKFLQLPHKKRLAYSLSGGQQRRLSFAISLLHQPEILILDEPTVGVDPLLRHMIWNYLRELSLKENCTILLTTHYLEEASQADMVGLMRSGHLLAQDGPGPLVQKHKTTTLEHVFLNLCIRDNEAIEKRENRRVSRKSICVPSKAPEGQSPKPPPIREARAVHRILAVIRNYFVRIRRMWRNYLLAIVLPAFIVLMYCCVFGSPPRTLKMAVVNHEWPDDPICTVLDDCLFLNLSCKFLQSLDHNMVTLVPYGTEESALGAVTNGDAWGVITFPSTYSESLGNRVLDGLSADNFTLENSMATLRMDMSNQHIGYTMQRMLLLQFAEFITQMLDVCGVNTILGSQPLTLGDAILSSNDVHSQNFMAPGVAVNINLAVCCLLSAAGIILDRESGSVKRAGVSGMNGWEYLTGFVLALQIGLSLQLLGIILTLYSYLTLPVFPAFPWMLLLLFIQGIMGHVYGILIAVITPNIGGLVFILIGTILPMLLCSGTLWPLEGVSYIWLRWICWTMPTTWATEATRSMMLRGWGINYFGVWMGFVSTIAWTAIFLISAALIMKYSKKRLFF